MADQKQQYLICDEARPKVARSIRTVLAATNNMFDRASRIDDRNIRYALLLDKICVATDLLTALATTLPEDCGLDRNLCDDIRATTTRVKTSLEELFTFVQNPNAPVNVAGHPIGHNGRPA